MLVAYKNIDQVIKARALQVIETTSYFSLCYLYLKKRQTIPVVVRVSTTFLQMMDSYYPYKSRLQRAIGSLEIRMISISRFLVTHAKDHAREMEQLYNIPAQNFTIIPHGISLPALGPGNLKGGDERVKILYVGRFEYRKGTDILLAAIPAIVEKNSQVYFELIGNDPENIYENEFNRKNPPAIIAQVKFSGNADNTATAKAYAGCDIFAAPSRYESFGLIYIEAMSYGKPVIGCNVGGVTEIIEDHKNGLLIPADDAAALTAGLELLINNRQLREEMGRQARITVEDRFTKEKLAENTMAYYNQAIKLFK
jgi:glycosyltransferase involved in cell wall biosynthesis